MPSSAFEDDGDDNGEEEMNCVIGKTAGALDKSPFRASMSSKLALRSR